MTCPAVRSVSGLTIACAKKEGHYSPKNPHKSGWIELGFMQRMAVGASRVRIEWFDA